MAASILIFPILTSFISFPVGFYPTVSEIGYYAHTTPVESQRVFVNETEKEYALKVGRTINVELEYTGQGYKPKYYYNADPEFGKITSIRQIRNDVDSMAFLIGELEYYSTNSSTSKRKNAILGYVRSLNTRYTNIDFLRELAFRNVCGDIDETFCRTIDNNLSHGLSFSEYFSSFISKDYHDKKDHPSAKFAMKQQSLIDPDNVEKEIDQSHLITKSMVFILIPH